MDDQQQPSPPAGDADATMPRLHAVAPDPWAVAPLTDTAPHRALRRVGLLRIIGSAGLVAVMLGALAVYAVGRSTGKTTAPLGQTANPFGGSTSQPFAGQSPTPAPTATVTPPPPGKATVIFTADSKYVQSPDSTLTVATDGSGQIPVLTRQYTATQVSTTVNAALITDGPGVTLTITNHSNQAYDSTDSLYFIVAKDGQTRCLIGQNLWAVPANGSIQVSCGRSPDTLAPMPALTWDDTTSFPPLEFTGQNPAWYYHGYVVPPNCGGPSVGQASVQAALYQTMAVDLVPGNSDNMLFNMTYTFDNASFACDAVPGTVSQTSFTYTVKLNGTMTVYYFSMKDVRAYQANLLQQQLPGSYAVASASICPELEDKVVIQDGYFPFVSPTKVVMNCSASGTGKRQWSASDLSKLASQIAGKTPQAATAWLYSVGGVAGGSVQIKLTGTNALPTNVNDITFVVN